MQIMETDVERNKLIVDLWKLGNSGMAIARKVGTTRNVILGVVSRYNHKLIARGLAPIARGTLNDVQKNSMNNVNAKSKLKVARRKPALPIAVIAAPPSKVILPMPNKSTMVASLLSVTGCRYIDTDSFCDATVHNNSSWCEYHYGKVFTPFIARKR